MTVDCTAGGLAAHGESPDASEAALLQFLLPGTSVAQLHERLSRLLAHSVPGAADLTVEQVLRYTAAFVVRAVVDLAESTDIGDPAGQVVVDPRRVDAFVAMMADTLRLLLHVPSAVAEDGAGTAGSGPGIDQSELLLVLAATGHSLRLAASELNEIDELLGSPVAAGFPA